MRKGHLFKVGETSLSVNVKSNEILEEKVEDPQREENRKMPLGWGKGWPQEEGWEQVKVFVDLKAKS